MATLVFSQDHPCNTRISDEMTGEILYFVKTKVLDDKIPVTEVRKASSGEVLAIFQWKKGFTGKADVVSLSGAESIPASNWIKKSMIPFSDTIGFKPEPWNQLKWKNYGPARQLELVDEENKSSPLARFKPSERAPNPMYGGKPAQLVISPKAWNTTPDARDRIVVSFLYLEKGRREFDDDSFRPTS